MMPARRGESDGRPAHPPDWSREGEAVSKTYSFDDFVKAIAFVRRVAERAEQVGRHPDIEVHYSQVKLTLRLEGGGVLEATDAREAAAFFDGVA